VSSFENSLSTDERADSQMNESEKEQRSSQ
jgi:hypothetical protein